MADKEKSLKEALDDTFGSSPSFAVPDRAEWQRDVRPLADFERIEGLDVADLSD